MTPPQIILSLSTIFPRALNTLNMKNIAAVASLVAVVSAAPQASGSSFITAASYVGVSTSNVYPPASSEYYVFLLRYMLNLASSFCELDTVSTRVCGWLSRSDTDGS